MPVSVTVVCRYESRAVQSSNRLLSHPLRTCNSAVLRSIYYLQETSSTGIAAQRKSGICYDGYRSRKISQENAIIRQLQLLQQATAVHVIYRASVLVLPALTETVPSPGTLLQMCKYLYGTKPFLKS